MNGSQKCLSAFRTPPEAKCIDVETVSDRFTRSGDRVYDSAISKGRLIIAQFQY